MPDYTISEVPVRSGLVGISPLPGRGGLLGQDLALIRGWQPGLVLSMTTGAEMACHGADGLGAALVKDGISWRHLPIEDFGTPPAAVQASWLHVSHEVAAMLSSGGRVLVHCMGGCGRSGMICLRLMVEAGEPPDAALSRLRSARSCAVETEDQRQWAIRLV